MNKTLLLISIFLLNMLSQAFCQQYKIQVVSSSPAETVVKVSVQSFDWKKQKGMNGKAVSVFLNDAKTVKVNEFLEIPELNFCLLQEKNYKPEVSCQILNSVDFDASNMASATDLTSASTTTNALPFEYAQLKNSFTDGDNTGMVLSVFPVQYLADGNKLRLCTEMLVKVSTPL